MKQQLKLQAHKLYFIFQDHRNSILLALSTVFIILLLFQFPYVQEHVSDLMTRLVTSYNDSYNLTFIKDLVTLIAGIVAATWTYYIFIKGRTFKPRISMDIICAGKCNPDIAIFRIIVRNEGRIRIRPLKAPVEFAFVTSSSDGGFGKNIPFCTEDNIFIRYYDSAESFFLEPQDELRIDIPVQLKNNRELSATCNIISNLISVKVVLVDSRIHAWTEKRIICLTM